MLHLQCDSKRILLIDQNPFKQNLRATILRNYEIEVHTATSAFDAEGLWLANKYDLILLAATESSSQAVTDQIRRVRPRQRIALLVGAPAYIQEVGGITRRMPRVTAMPSREVAEVVMSPQWQEMVQRMITGRLAS
jgi:CheY-like chemotaxis protein